MGQLEGKVAIITGVGAGIGRAAAKAFLEEGAMVVGAERSQRRLDETGALLCADLDRLALVCCDVAEEEAVAGLVALALERFGRLDAPFANAGIGGGMVQPEMLDVAQFNEVMRINLMGPALLIKHATPHLRRQKSGSIIVTASIAGLRGRSAGIEYSCSKAAAIALVQNTALSVGRDGVRCNAICPAGTDTSMTRKLFDMLISAKGTNPIADINPTGRVGAPEDMANLAVFLASDRSAYINGQAINVCGGLSASHPFAPDIPYL